MKTEILIIDDHMSLHDPFVRSIRKNRPEAVVTVLDDAGKGVEYISNDLRKKVVVFWIAGSIAAFRESMLYAG